MLHRKAVFLISLKMIFQSSAAIFSDDYADDPILVPIAGPAAITTLMILRSQQQATLWEVVISLLGVLAITAAVFLAGSRLQEFLGQRGISAMEKFMGLLLNLLAVNMTLEGLRGFLA